MRAGVRAALTQQGGPLRGRPEQGVLLREGRLAPLAREGDAVPSQRPGGADGLLASRLSRRGAQCGQEESPGGAAPSSGQARGSHHLRGDGEGPGLAPLWPTPGGDPEGGPGRWPSGLSGRSCGNAGRPAPSATDTAAPPGLCAGAPNLVGAGPGLDAGRASLSRRCGSSPGGPGQSGGETHAVLTRRERPQGVRPGCGQMARAKAQRSDLGQGRAGGPMRPRLPHRSRRRAVDGRGREGRDRAPERPALWRRAEAPRH